MSRRTQRDWYVTNVAPRFSRRAARKRARRRVAGRNAFAIERLEQRFVLSADPLALASAGDLISALGHDCSETEVACPAPVGHRVIDPREFSLQWFAGDATAQSAALEWPFFDNDETFLLHSNPGATKKIYLDFDGHVTTGTVWNTGAMPPLPNIFSPAFDVDGDARFNDFEHQVVQLVWALVSEDFLPFDVDVTTEDPGEDALKKVGGSDQEYGVRVVLSGLSTDWYTQDMPIGGVAQLNSFSFNTDTPVFVFPFELGNVKNTAEATSHEVGHSFGLSHDGDAPPFVDPPNEYYPGHGAGPVSWGPIMGAAYDVNVTQWSKGEYPWANNIMQDDLAVITGAQHGVTYRTDDHGNDALSATVMAATGTEIFAEGIIEQTADLDYFAFDLGVEEITFEIDPHPWLPNLDIEAKIYNADGDLIETSNPIDGLSATFTLNTRESDLYVPGRYYLSIDGTGKPATTDPGYSDYGSLGYYTISAARKSLLDIIVGVEFDIPLAEGGTRPDNWAIYDGGGAIAVLSDLKNEAGNTTPINLTIQSGGGTITSHASPILTDTAPLHPQSLEDLDGYISVPAGDSLSFTWSDLNPLTVYEVYVFGASDVGVTQDVEIVGDATPITFIQTVSSTELEINDQTGDPARQLLDFTKLVMPDEMGRISITVNSTDELLGPAIAALAIRPSTLGSIGGVKWNDINGNGVHDGPDDPEDPLFEGGLPGWTIFLDENGNGQLDESFVETVHSGDVPQTIQFRDDPDPAQRTIKSELFVEGIRSIHDLNVTLDITHTFVGDLNAYLISPSGTRVKLFSDVGNENDDFDEVTFDDEALTAIASGVAQTDPEPAFSGSYRPEVAIDPIEFTTYGLGLSNLLSTFDGEDANGKWILEIKDDAPVDDGVLNSWSLTISGREESTVTDAEGKYEFEDLSPGVYNVAEVINPSGSSLGVTVPSSDVPQDILDGATATSELLVQNIGEILDVDITFDITHTFTSDLTVFLISPSGTRVPLFDGVGLDGDNFTNTVLDDEATISITGGFAPFTGRFRPQGVLSDFDGQDANGIWTLEITDNFLLDQGTLNSWSLTFTGSQQGSWVQTFAPPPVTLTSGGRVRGIDFGNWVPDVEVLPARISGQKFNDLNADGVKDEGEPGLPDWTIFVDGNNNGILDEEAEVTVDATDIPKPIRDFETTTSELEFVGLSSIVDLNITLDIVHSFDADLDVYLISPSGTQVELFTGVGREFNDFTDTTLDDEAETLIVNASAPFSGRFRAEGLLSDFDGEDPNGLWKLLIRDTTEADTGALISWSLTIVGSERSTVTDVDGNFEFGDLAAGEYIIREVQQPGWRQTLAPPTPLTVEDAEQLVADFGNTVALAGDYNGDSIVDSGDYLVWRKSNGQSVAPFTGADGDGDGDVDQGDYDIWRENFGMTLPSGGGASLAAASFAEAAPAAGSDSAAARAKVPATAPSVAASRAASQQFVGNTLAVAESAAGNQRGAIARHRPAARAQLGATPASNDAALLEWATKRTVGRPDRDSLSEFAVIEHSDAQVGDELNALDYAFEALLTAAS